MAEEFQGGVCGGMWWNPSKSLFSGGGATSLSSPCSVAQLGGGGGFDMGSFGWPNEVLTKGTKAINNIHSNFDNTLVFPCDLDSTLDWSQPNIFCNEGSNEANFGSIMLEDEINSSNIMNTNMNNFNNLDASPPMAATSGDSSTITSEGGLINSSFSMSSSASYLIQTLFDDTDESQLLQSQLPISQLPMNSQNYGCVINSSDLNWVKPSSPNLAPPLPSPQLGQKFDLDVGMNMLVNGGQDAMNGQYSTTTNLGNNIRASLINSLKSRSRAPTFNIQKSQNSVYLATKVNKEEDQPLAKRPRIETPSHMPTFKVRKEKLGDRITALQQLVSPFGKTDTASVLHEAIEYIKFLHDQVNALSTPYLKNGSPMQHQQEKEEDKQNLKRQGLCLVPISSTYPVVQETPVDFWTPTFGGPSFR